MTVPASPSRDDTRLWLVGILVVALILRLAGLWAWPFEQDELYTITDAADLGANANARGAPGIMGRPLYYLLQHALMQVLPTTEFWARVPAMVFGVLGVWATWALAAGAFGPIAGLTAGGLVAISPWHLYASQFARYWSLVYLLAALTFLWIVRALDSDEPRTYLKALAFMLLGMLTHPTFLLPFLGIGIALCCVGTDGSIRWKWPSRRAWLFLIGPALGVLLAGRVLLAMTGHERSLQNWSGRGFAATLRLVPAIVQWVSPELTIAGLALVAVLWASRGSNHRRWAAVIALGTGATVLILLVLSFRTDVYADYAIAALPLVFLSVGAGIQLVANALPRASGAFALISFAVLAAGLAPATVSHFSDGSRHDYRNAYNYILANGPDYPVFGWPSAVQKRYAPGLKFSTLRSQRQLENTPAFWLLTSHQRYGILVGARFFEAWIDQNCRRVQTTRGIRVDYRDYRVDLHWCGPDPPPHRSTP